MFFSLLLLIVAGLLAVPVFTGKGRLLSTDNIKKDKLAKYKKWVRILYAVMMVVVLFMACFMMSCFTPRTWMRRSLTVRMVFSTPNDER